MLYDLVVIGSDNDLSSIWYLVVFGTVPGTQVVCNWTCPFLRSLGSFWVTRQDLSFINMCWVASVCIILPLYVRYISMCLSTTVAQHKNSWHSNLLFHKNLLALLSTWDKSWYQKPHPSPLAWLANLLAPGYQEIRYAEPCICFIHHVFCIC